MNSLDAQRGASSPDGLGTECVWPDERIAEGARVRAPHTEQEYTVISRDEYMMIGKVTLETVDKRRIHANHLEVFVPDAAIDPGPSYWEDRARKLAVMS